MHRFTYSQNILFQHFPLIITNLRVRHDKKDNMSNTITLTTCISFRRGGSYNSLWFIALTLPYIRVQWSPGQACAGCWVSPESLSFSQALHKLLTGETHHSFISAQGGQGGTTFLVSLVSNFFVRIVFQWQQKYYMTIKNYANLISWFSTALVQAWQAWYILVLTLFELKYNFNV